MSPLDAFDAAYMQRALLEALLLALIGGLLGTWIVLRRLAFFTHAVGTSAFPGLVLADAWSVNAQLLALVSGLGFAGGVNSLVARRRVGQDAATGLLLVLALALGVVLASDVYESGAGVDRLLFGSLIGLSDLDIWLTALAAAAVLAANLALRRAWLATGFDPGSARALGIPAVAADWLLLSLIAAAVIVALAAVGALLVTAVLVVPAATVRLVARDLRTLQAGAVALAAAEAVVGLYLANEWNVGPGATIAVLSGAVFALVALARAATARLRPAGEAA